MNIEVRNLWKKFGDFTALADVNFDVRSGELLALLGPSGCGKTTLLRILAGLEPQTSGVIRFDGQDAGAQDVRARRVGFVFQHYALFPHMTVFENIAFGLRVKPRSERPSEKQIRDKVTELLRLVKMEELARRRPSELSGGQRQRVALARALAVEPRMLLLDEPFGALDARVRQELRRRLRRLHDELGVTTVFVTHDQEEALELADRLVVLNKGRVEQIGTPEEVYHHPANEFVFDFLGDFNLFRCRIEEGRLQIVGSGTQSPDTQRIFVRPHALDLTREPTSGNFFKAMVLSVNPAGPTVKIELESEWGDRVQAAVSQEKYRSLQLGPGTELYVQPLDMHRFD